MELYINKRNGSEKGREEHWHFPFIFLGFVEGTGERAEQHDVQLGRKRQKIENNMAEVEREQERSAKNIVRDCRALLVFLFVGRLI